MNNEFKTPQPKIHSKAAQIIENMTDFRNKITINESEPLITLKKQDIQLKKSFNRGSKSQMPSIK